MTHSHISIADVQRNAARFATPADCGGDAINWARQQPAGARSYRVLDLSAVPKHRRLEYTRAYELVHGVRFKDGPTARLHRSFAKGVAHEHRCLTWLGDLRPFIVRLVAPHRRTRTARRRARAAHHRRQRSRDGPEDAPPPPASSDAAFEPQAPGEVL